MASYPTTRALAPAIGHARATTASVKARHSGHIVGGGCSLLVRNLPEDATSIQLQQLFGGASHDLTVSLHSAPDLSWNRLVARYAFVHFNDPRHARRVLEQFDGKVQLDGARLELFICPARASDALAMGLQPPEHSLLVFQASNAGTTTEEILALLGRSGRVRWIHTSRDGRGTVHMDSLTAAAAAIAMALDDARKSSGKLVVGWAEMFLTHASCVESMKHAIQVIRSSAWDPSRIVYSGIPRTESPAAIADVFRRVGEVVLVAPNLPWGPADGSGVVTMASEQSAKDAVAGLNALFTWPGADRPLVVGRWVQRAESSSSCSSNGAANSHSKSTAQDKQQQPQQQLVQQAPPGCEPVQQQAAPPGGNSNNTANSTTSYNATLPLHGHLLCQAMPPSSQYNYQVHCPPPPSGRSEQASALPDSSTGAVTWLVDATTGRQQPVYRLPDGRLLMVTGGTAPMPPPGQHMPASQQLQLSAMAPASEQPQPQLSAALISTGAASCGVMQPHPLQPLLAAGLDQPQQQLYLGEPRLQQATFPSQQLPTCHVLVAPCGSLAPAAPLPLAELQPQNAAAVVLQPAAAPTLSPGGFVAPQLAAPVFATPQLAAAVQAGPQPGTHVAAAPQMVAAGHPLQSDVVTNTQGLMGLAGTAVQLGMVPALGAGIQQVLAVQGGVALHGSGLGLVAGAAW